MSISEADFVTGEHPVVVMGEIPVVQTVVSVDFDEFYHSTRVSVIRALSATVGSADLAVESTDEALARAYQRWDRVGHLDNPAGWTYRVALNHARNRLRYTRRRRAVPLDAGAEFADGADVIVADPAVADALMTLSLDHRAVVVCRLLLGWSEHQTADALAIRPGTVKSRLSRALSTLERRLEHLRPEDQK